MVAKTILGIIFIGICVVVCAYGLAVLARGIADSLIDDIFENEEN